MSTSSWDTRFSAARAALFVIASAFGACSPSPEGEKVVLPGAEPGIGFDDLGYSKTLGALLVPAGRSGRVDLVDVDTLKVRSIAGFSRVDDYSGGHDDGPTAVDEGRGYLFVTDRTAQKLSVVDETTLGIVATAPLAASPDYPRFVASKDELWLTEPSASQIEIFSLAPSGVPVPTSSGVIAVDDGPESLVIDEVRGRAYTHRWHASTLAFELSTRKLVAEWPNGCAASRGIALDREFGLLVAACNEGTLSVLDVAHEGRIVSHLAKGAGFDVIGLSQTSHRVYAAGSACNCLIVASLSPKGELDFVSRTNAASGSSCATGDERGHGWFCDPEAGAVWRVSDR